MTKIKQDISLELGNKNIGSTTVNSNIVAEGITSQLKLIENYSNQILLASSIEVLVKEAINGFTQVFKQPLTLVYEYDKNRKALHLLNTDIDPNEIPVSIPFNNALIEVSKESFLLVDTPIFKEKFAPIGMKNAIVSSFFSTSDDFSGFIISGHCKKVMASLEYVTSEYLSLSSIMANLVGSRFENIKDHELIEIERQSLEAQLKRSNEDLEQFAYIISHDLKAPLRNIKSFAQLLQKMYRSQLDGDGVTFLNFITGGVSKFDNLINDLLQYSRVSRRAMPFEELDLNDVLEEVKLSTFITNSKKDVSIKSEKLPTIFANSQRIEQLLQCLVDNAVKFKQDGIKTEISISVKENKDYIQLAVTDNGIGIESQYSERIFQLFQKLHADSEYSGTGLGLSICKKIIERHKGKIWMESEGLKKGTTFYVELPKNLSNHD